MTEGILTAGSLSKFVIYALYVGTNTGAVANVISQLIQVCISGNNRQHTNLSTSDWTHPSSAQGIQAEIRRSKSLP